MGLPVAIEREGASQQAPVGLRQTLPDDHGVGLLAERIALHIETLVPRGRARCLDVGCGDMTMADAVEERAPRTDWRCIDVHPLPRGRHDESRWRKYQQFDGSSVPYGEDEFDIALLCDVLHRIPENAARLLAEAGRVARRVIVKERFEYGAYSRSMLRLMNFVGNWGYGIAVPEGFFTRDGFVRLAAEQGLVIKSLDCGLELYEHPPVGSAMRRPDSHFVAVLQRS
jgi:SAM-dependent methyltransferase